MKASSALALVFASATLAVSASGQESTGSTAVGPVVVSRNPVKVKEVELTKAVLKVSGPCDIAPIVFNPPKRLGEFAGPVKNIQVLRYSSYSDVATDPVKVLTEVWAGNFDEVNCFIDWDEGAFWRVEASIAFEDGRPGRIFTDGNHVALRDRGGKWWFMRLRTTAPAKN